MKNEHRKMLAELQSICNWLGNDLDGTATNPVKYIERQRAHHEVADILFAVLADHPENDNRADDFERAYESLEKLRELKSKIYPDRNGFLKPEEIEKLNKS